jgi:hypothetical protein
MRNPLMMDYDSLVAIIPDEEVGSIDKLILLYESMQDDAAFMLQIAKCYDDDMSFPCANLLVQQVQIRLGLFRLVFAKSKLFSNVTADIVPLTLETLGNDPVLLKRIMTRVSSRLWRRASELMVQLLCQFQDDSNRIMAIRGCLDKLVTGRWECQNFMVLHMLENTQLFTEGQYNFVFQALKDCNGYNEGFCLNYLPAMCFRHTLLNKKSSIAVLILIVYCIMQENEIRQDWIQ